MAKAKLMELILWTLCTGLKRGAKIDHVIEFIDVFEDLSCEPGTR